MSRGIGNLQREILAQVYHDIWYAERDQMPGLRMMYFRNCGLPSKLIEKGLRPFLGYADDRKCLTDAERASLSRAFGALQRRDLLDRYNGVTGGAYANMVKLTTAGEEMARRILREEPGRWSVESEERMLSASLYSDERTLADSALE